MNIKEYISSGIIELYAAGSLTEKESAEVEYMIRTNSDIKDDYNRIQNTIYLASSLNLKSPSDSVKSSLLNKIKTDSKKNDSDLNKNFNSNVNTAQTKNSNPENKFIKYLMAASIAFLLFSLGTNYFLWDKLKDAKNEILVLNDEKKLLVQDLNAVSRKLTQSSNDIKIMSDKNFITIDLKGLEKSPTSNAVAFWNPQTKKLFIEVENLPVPPPDKQYQLWALDNGVPVDAGIMDVDPTDKSLHLMKTIDNAQAFAITLEPKGGSKNPTMTEMYVMGKI
ncbi:MAG: anti-sigma factor [Ignavibacteria bacterium]|nr:anti-sigma factor [Ignavibacteria bacterium]